MQWYTAVKGPHINHVTKRVGSSASPSSVAIAMTTASSIASKMSTTPQSDEVVWGESVYFDVSSQDFSSTRRISAWGKLSAHHSSRRYNNLPTPTLILTQTFTLIFIRTLHDLKYRLDPPTLQTYCHSDIPSLFPFSLVHPYSLFPFFPFSP